MDEMPRKNYELEDFISDESFINYHFRSNKEDQLSWEEWLLNNPGKQSLAEEAREIMNELSFRVSEKEYREELKRLTSAIERRKSQPPLSKFSGGNKFLQFYQKRKRAILFLVPLLIIIMTGGLWLFQRTQNDTGKLTETVNNSTEPLILTLSDGSVVSLAPHGYLQYPLYFIEKERNVYLHGNAQFSVKRNIEHPFKVHAENIVATVLGLSLIHI